MIYLENNGQTNQTKNNLVTGLNHGGLGWTLTEHSEYI